MDYPRTIRFEHAQVKIYKTTKGVFSIVWNAAGKRHNKQRSTEKDALDFAKQTARELAAKGSDVYIIGKRDAALLNQLKRIPNPEGLLHELEDTAELVGSVHHIAKYARRFVECGYHKIEDITVENAIVRYIEHCSGRPPQSLNGTKTKLRKLAPFYSASLLDITTEQLDRWYRQIGSIEYSNKVFAEVRTFFGKCQDWKYLPEGKMAIDRITRKKNPERHPSLWSPVEIEKLITSLREDCIPYFVLCAFAGLRPSEAAAPRNSILWEDINWEKQRLLIRSEVAGKTGKRRWVDLRGHAVEWLLPYRKASGKICMTNSARLVSEDLKEKGLIESWPNGNVLRHCFISYLLATTDSLELVRRQAGTSESMIKKHYDFVPSREDGEAFFAISPNTKQRTVAKFAS